MMTQVWRYPTRLPLLASLFSFTLPLCIIGALAPLTTTVAQQVTPDGSVSTTVITPDGKNFTINDGTTRGGNLFHSFKEFSVPIGGSANFNNAANIQNIISRVTGGNASNIDGAIRALGKANLFLLNPAGIMFGPNASLQIGGSFLGSTANSFLFDNGFEFSATDLQAPPLLTINIPIGLRYRDNPQPIQVQGRGHDINFQAIKTQPRDRVNNSVPGLELESGKTLALVGGKVSVEGGILKSSVGRIEIGSVASNGVVSLAPIQEGWKLGYEGITSFGDINFSGKTFLDTTGVGGGSIAVAGKNINFAGESILLADTLGDRNAGEIRIIGDKISVVESEIGSFTFGSGNAGQVKLIADKSILLENNGGAGTNTQGLGKAGEITVQADSIEIRNQSGLGSNTFGEGDAGRIEVKANSFLLIEDNSGFGSSSNGEGNAGEINIAAGDFIIRNSAGLTVEAKGAGDGGKINVTANSLLIEDSSTFTSATKRGSTGQSGEINVNTAGSLVVRNNSNIKTSTGGTGNAGKISITANSLLIENSSGFNNGTEQGSTGQGGEINVNIAGPLVVRKNAGISGNTSGAGNAGKISITANSLLISDSSGFFTNTQNTGQAGEINLNIAGPLVFRNYSGMYSNTSGTGDAGKINVTANSLLISDFSGLFTRTQNTGQAGEINLNIAGPLVFRNYSGMNSDTSGTGNAGQITISAESLEISNVSEIVTATTSSGNAGNLNVRAKTLFLDNNGRLRVESTGTGNAGTLKIVADTIKLDNQSLIDATTTGGQGNITLNSGDLILRHNSAISANGIGTADGSNISITTDNLVALENSDITARAEPGLNGNVIVRAKSFFPSPDSDITATSVLGPQLFIEYVDPSQGLFELLETIPDPAQQIAQHPCIKGFGSTFTIVGRGGLPTDPNKILSNDNVRVDLVKPVPSTVNSTSATQKEASAQPPVKKIIPARGWIFNEKGEVLLVGYDPTKTGPQREPRTPASSCAGR